MVRAKEVQFKVCFDEWRFKLVHDIHLKCTPTKTNKKFGLQMTMCLNIYSLYFHITLDAGKL